MPYAGDRIGARRAVNTKMPENHRDSPHFHVSPHVRYVSLSDRVVILDLRSESYYALEPLASAIWRELSAGKSMQECLEIIGMQLGTIDRELNENVDAFARQCTDNGLMLHGLQPACADKAPAKIAPAVKRPLFPGIRAWMILTRTARSLARKGFGATYGEALQAPVPPDGGTDASVDLLTHATAAFARAENFYHLKKAPRDCLPRSLALFFFLRSMGLPASHCIGVRRFPFTAHAWTECLGEVIHDHGSNRSEFTVIARIDP